jgi:hypothetical protein
MIMWQTTVTIFLAAQNHVRYKHLYSLYLAYVLYIIRSRNKVRPFGELLHIFSDLNEDVIMFIY